MTFGLQQFFQISLERGLCFNHRIERLLHLGRQIICIDVLPYATPIKLPRPRGRPAWSKSAMEGDHKQTKTMVQK
jgi:hypothetical protein